MWQENWKKAASLLLDAPIEHFDEDYAKNIVLGGYMDSAFDRFSDAGLFEFACRPAWSRSEIVESQIKTALGEPDDYDMPTEAKKYLLLAIEEIEATAHEGKEKDE